jgi:large repetitive protein
VDILLDISNSGLGYIGILSYTRELIFKNINKNIARPTPPPLPPHNGQTIISAGHGQLVSHQVNCILTAGHGELTNNCNPTPPQQSGPIANAGPNQVVSQGSIVTLNGAGSSAQNGATIVSYSWIQTSGTPVSLNGANTAAPTFTAPTVSTSTALTFSLIVTDSNGAVSAPDSVTITLNPSSSNQPPIAIATPQSQIVSRGSLVTLDGTGSFDPSGNSIVFYSWVQTSGITVALSGVNSATPTFTALSINTTLTFNLTVTNSAGIQSIITPQSTVSIIVR